LSADGMRAVSARQKTLNNAIGWSYDFLSSDEQRLFNFLSVFSGGFTLDAVESVFSRMSKEKSITDLIAMLSDKSMLQPVRNERSEAPFNMLATIQQFALERLRRSGEESQARDAHLAYFLALAETGDMEIRGPRQVEWADRIQDEQNNMRAALEWAVSNQNTESALRLLCALGWPWEIRGHYSEARSWLGRIRVLPDVNKYPEIYTRILNHIGRYNWTQDNVQEARALLDESRVISTGMGVDGEKNLAETLNWLGVLEIGNDKTIAKALLEQSLALNRQCEDDWGITLSTFHLGILESNLEHHEDAALSLLEESLARFRQFGDLFFVSRVSVFLGYVFLDREEYDMARQFFEQHVEIDTKLRFWDGMAEGWRDLGNLYRKQGDMEKAEMYYEQSRTVCREHGLNKTVP
jgi:tetratricopeptide (TPR) repeat protein